jgi:hypothetical protein
VIEVPQFDHLSCFSYNYFKILTIFQNICLDTENPFKKLIKTSRNQSEKLMWLNITNNFDKNHKKCIVTVKEKKKRNVLF